MVGGWAGWHANAWVDAKGWVETSVRRESEQPGGRNGVRTYRWAGGWMGERTGGRAGEQAVGRADDVRVGGMACELVSGR